MSPTRKLVFCALLAAFGVVLPIAFHLVGALGSVFLPMHIPVLVAGLFLGTYAGVGVGVLAPIIGSFLTGMPPIMPILPIMVAELAVYGGISGYLSHRRGWGLLISLVTSMVAGRLAAAVVAYVMVNMITISIKPIAFITGAVVTGLPGIAIQLLVVPMLVTRLREVFIKIDHRNIH